MRARCTDGPYAGQTFEFPQPRVAWYAPWNGHQHVAELVWIIDGAHRHCYRPTENGWGGDWRLVYRDTF